MNAILPLDGQVSLTTIFRPAPVFTSFADMAEASQLSAAGQALLCGVQVRIVDALLAAGFETAVWVGRPRTGSSEELTRWQTLQIVDPLTQDVLGMALGFRLQRSRDQVVFRLDAGLRNETEGRQLTQGSIAYQAWSTVDLAAMEAQFQEAYLALVAPDGLADSVFSDLAYKLTLAVAP